MAALRVLALAAAAVGYAGVTAAPGWASAPTVSLTAPSDGAFVSGSTDFSASAADTGTGVGGVQFEYATTPSGPYTTFATVLAPGTDGDYHGVWSSRPADGGYWIRAEAFDTTTPTADSSATDPIQVTLDDASPSISVTCTTQGGDGVTDACGWYQSGDAGIEVCASADDGSGSGVATLVYTDDGSDPLSSDSAHSVDGCFGSYGSDTTVRFGAVDGAGNANERTVQIRFDDTAPPAPHVSLGPASSASAFLQQIDTGVYRVWYRPDVDGTAQVQVPAGDDPESGVSTVSFVQATDTGWSGGPDGGPPFLSATYSWAAGTTTGFAFDAASTNGVGLQGPSSSVTFQPDTLAPTGGIDCVPASCANPNGPVTVHFTGSDIGSGIAQVRYTTDGSTPSATHGTVGDTIVVTAPTPNIAFWAVDDVGNAQVAATGGVAIAGNTSGLAQDLLANALGSHANPFGPWEMMTASGTAHDPATYHDIQAGSFGHPCDPGIAIWQDPDIANTGINTTSSTISGNDCAPSATYPPHVALAHPGPSNLVVYAWHSPGTGSVTINGGMTDLDCGGGNGISWSVDLGATTLESGTFGNCGSATFTSDLTVDVGPTDTIYFVVDPNGEYSYDSTEVDASVDFVATPPPATPIVGASLTDGWVELDGWLPGSSVSLTVDEQPSGTYIVDGQGHAFLQTPPNADRLHPGTDVVASDGIQTATVALANVGFDSLDLGTGAASGHAPVGSTVHVELNPVTGNPIGGQDVSAPNGSWSADFAPELPLSPPVTGTATLFDGSGDFTAASIHLQNPHVDASITNDWIHLEGWAPNTTADVTIDDTDTYSVAIDGNGHGDLERAASGHDLVPGISVDVSDGAQATGFTLADPASFDSFDAFKDVASGTAPFGSPVSVCVGGQTPGCVDANVQDNDTWTADLSPLAPIAPGTHATASIDDGNGNHTVVEADATGGAIVVTNTDDSGPGSLRQAILDANGRSGADTITFDIPGSGTQTISPQTPLPAITDAVTIDGYTQPGAQPATVLVGEQSDAVLEIVLDGSALAPGAAATAGLDVQASDSTIRGLVVGGGFSYGIWLDGTGATRDLVVGNYLGTNATGTQTRGLNQFGLLVSDGASNDVVGTAHPADRNVLSGTTGISPGGGAGLAIARGAHDNAVAGNLIGTTADGKSPLPNGTGVVIESGAHDNRIGGARSDENIVSENSGAGVLIQQEGTSGNVVSGNFVGVTWIGDGTVTDSGNGGDGVSVTEGASATISANTIENNHGNGVATQGAGAVTISANGIHSNGGLGIDVGSDGVTPNDPRPDTDGVQNFPVITDVGSGGTVSGTLDSAPNTAYRLELFTTAACDPSGYGEGRGFRDATTVTTDGNGHATFTAPITIDGQTAGVTATATDPGGRTSEFSQCFALISTPSTLTVNTADDHDDGSCSAVDCSLREAIAAANAHPGADTIDFAIAVGPQTLHLVSPLPAITDAVTIDGTSQPGWLAAPIVTLDGSGLVVIEGPGFDGLVVDAPNTTIRGLVVDGFPGIGIHVLDVDGAVVAGNYLGVDASGAAAAGNSGDGVRIEFGSGAVVGGPSPLDRNVVGGNLGHGIFLDGATNATVRGNYSGTNAAGSSALGNGIDGIAVDGGTGNTIAGNLASGNTNQGISLFGVFNAPPAGTTVRGNEVGTDAAGTGTISNGGRGILVSGASATVVGGLAAGQGNVVHGNGAAGVEVSAGAAGATISGNSIDGNGDLGILLASGSNHDQAAPVVASADAVAANGTLAAAAAGDYRIEVFESAACDPSGRGEGNTFLGSAVVTAAGAGALAWSVPAAVDPGDAVTATATALATGDTSAFSQCLNLGSVDMHASLTVDQSSSPVGATQFPLDSLPPQLFTQLATGDPASAPIPTAPIPTAAVGAAPIPTAPIPTAPIPTAPIPTAPIPTAPIPTAPIPTAPIPTAPIPTAGLGGLPIPTASTAPNPLDAILLSSLPGIDAVALFDGTPLAGRLVQQYTLGDVYRTPVALDRFNNLKVAAVPLSQTLLRGVRTLSYLLGGKTLDHIRLPGGQDWCSALTGAGGSCANVDVTRTTVIGLDIMGQLGSLDLGHLTVGALTGGLDGTLVGEAYLARTAFQETTIANIPATPQFVTCSACATLGDAAAAHAVRDQVPLKALGSAANGVTLNELVVALSPRNALPWEQESFLGWQGFGGQAQQLRYHLDLDVPCPVTTALTLRVRLPFGFVYVPGSTVFTIGTGTPTAGADPALDPKTGATWTAPQLGTCTQGQTQHVRLDFKGEAGFQIGPTLATATIGVNGGASQVSGAPVVVQRGWTAAGDRSTAPTIQPDTIVLSHIDHAGGTNFFRLPELGRGKLVTVYLKPPAGVDYDLYAVRPAPASLLASPIPTAPIPTAPIPTAPIPTAPIPTADTSVTTTTDNPPPELSDDGPLPGGQVAVNSITRGDGVEVVTFRQAGATGFDEIAVAGYNGAFSDQPFELRARVDDPAQLPPACPARTFLGGNPVQAGQLPAAPLPADTQALALVNVGRMNAMYGAAPAAAMLAKLSTVLGMVHGQVLQIDGDAGVFQAAQAWDASPCSIDAANAYVHAINVLVASYRGNLTNLRSITLVGDDEQIPFARVPDFVPVNSEFDNTGSLAYLTQNGTVDNATFAAAGLGYVLTDDAYGAFHTRTLFGHEFFLPEVALGRLVETPDEIAGQLQRFVDAGGKLDATTGFVSGYDFMSDGAKAVDDGLAKRIGPAPSATNTLIRDTWTKSAIEPLLTGAEQPAAIDSVNAHYDAYRLMPAVYSGPSDLLSTALLPSPVTVPLFANRILFTMGCHAGESIADTLSVAPLDLIKQRDWAQAFAQAGAAVFVANTGFGYGDTGSVALSERLMTLFAGHLGFDGAVGEKFLQSKADYFASMGAYGPYDEKAIEQATFYGLPFWQVNSPTEPAPTPPAPLSPDGALQTAPLTIAPTLTRVNDPRGTFWKGAAGTVFVPGRSVQPLETREVTQDASTGLVAHGFFPGALVTDDSNKSLNLYFARPMIDLGAHEPEPSVTNDVFPASPVKVAQADYLGRRHSTVELIAGQSRPGGSPSRQNERLITSIGGVVTYAPASVTDYTPPSFQQTGAFVSGGQATIFATVRDDASGVLRVRAFYTTGGAWTFVDLQPVAGVANAWRATVAVGVSKIEIGTVAEDGAGNTGWMTGKGILVESFTPSTPPPPPAITIDSPLDGGTFTVGQRVVAVYSCTSAVPLAGCAGPVASGANADTAAIGAKQFPVTATPLIGSGATKTAHYTVVFDFGGFQPPISSSATNTVKAGSAVPVKFSLHGNFGLGILAPGYPQSGPVPCTGGAIDTGITTDTAGKSSLEYDAGSDTYTYVWKTEKSWSGCRQLLVVLNDGVVHRATFKFK